MASDGQSIERLRDYLRGLKPEAHATLVQKLERGLLRGDDDPGKRFVLEELRRTIRAAAQPVPRIGAAARLFFAPLEPFLVDGGPDHGRVGRVARASLEPIWEWIRRDLMPAEVKALGEDVNRALLADDKAKAEQLARALQDRAILRLRDALAAAGADEKARRRLAVQVGTPRALEDVATLFDTLEIRDPLNDLARRLPSHMRVFEREAVDQVLIQLDAVTAAAPKSPDRTAAAKYAIIRYGLVLMMDRLTAPWQLIRIAVRAADSDDVSRIAQTPYAVAVAIVLGEFGSTLGELRGEFRAGRALTSTLRELHDTARGLRAEMDLAVDSAWSRQLAAMCSDVSDFLRPEIESAPARVRRLLRPRPAKDIPAGSVLDADDIAEAEARVEFVAACRNYAGELALSEATLRACSDLTQYLENGTNVLLDSLRHAGESDRPFRQSQVDAAIRLCRTLFGRDYAGLLAKAAGVAAQTAAIERKSVRA